MHIILGLLGAFTALMIWYWRVKAAQEAAGEAAEVVGDVRAAIRRLRYSRGRKTHPCDAVDDPRLAAAGVVLAVAGLDAPLSRAELDAMTREAERVFEVDPAEAEEITAFGRWIVGQCDLPEAAARRLLGTIRGRVGPEAGRSLLEIAGRVAGADGAVLDERQRDLLDEIARQLGVRTA